MSEIVISHGCAQGGEPFIPQVCRVTGIVEETPDVKTFRVQTLEGNKPFSCQPGQLGMLSVIPVGESMFCVSGQGDDYIEFTVKRVGRVTEELHALEVGAQVGVRGPYGNWFPYESCKGRDMLFIAGGIGFAPVRAFVLYCLAHREEYGRVDVVYSASTKKDLVFKTDLFENWPQEPDVHLHVSVYHGGDDWDGVVSYTAPYLESLGLSTQQKAVVLCGGPSLYRTCSKALKELGYEPEDIITTLEMRMKCGVGKCGRCNIGGKLICLDGPVFTQAELAELPRDE